MWRYFRVKNTSRERIISVVWCVESYSAARVKTRQSVSRHQSSESRNLSLSHLQLQHTSTQPSSLGSIPGPVHSSPGQALLGSTPLCLPFCFYPPGPTTEFPSDSETFTRERLHRSSDIRVKTSTLLGILRNSYYCRHVR